MATLQRTLQHFINYGKRVSFDLIEQGYGDKEMPMSVLVNCYVMGLTVTRAAVLIAKTLKED